MDSKKHRHDLQTFSDLTKIKSLDSRRRNFSTVKKADDVRLPSWLMIKENDFSLIGEMVKLKQLSCLREIKEEAQAPKAAEQPCGEGTLSEGSPASEEPLQVGAHIRKGDITAFCTGTGGDGTLQFGDLFWLSDWNPDFPQDQVLSLPDGYYYITVCTKRPESGYWGDGQIICLYFNRLEEMPKLAWQGVPYLFTEEREAEPQDMSTQGQNQREYMEMIRQLYGVEELQGYTEEELTIVKKYFNSLPPVLEEFWKRAARTEAIHKVQDRWIRQERSADFYGRPLPMKRYLHFLFMGRSLCTGLHRRN